MAVVFVNQPGSATVVPDPSNGAPLPFGMSGWSGGGAFKAIVTAVSGTQKDALQAVPAFQRRVFVDSFGCEPGMVRVAGVAFTSGCSDDAASGIEYVRDFYDSNRASVRPDPITILIGSTGAARDVGFLIGCEWSVDRPDLLMTSFAMSILTMPKRSQ